MTYEAKIRLDYYAYLDFTRKNGEVKSIYLGYAKDGALAELCLSALYDFYQCDDEFGDDAEIKVEGVGTFKTLKKIHIVPADEATQFAVVGVTKEQPFRVSYRGWTGPYRRRSARSTRPRRT